MRVSQMKATLTSCARALVAAVTIGLTATAASAQTVEELVAKHIAARGGYERIKAIHTIKMTRTMATPFNKMQVVIYKKRPGLYRAEQASPGQPATARGVNGETAWDQGPGGKVTARPAQGAAEARDLDGDFDGPLVDWKEKGHTVTLQGKELLPGGEVYTLKVGLKSGLVRYIYLDAQSYLDRRHMGVVNISPTRQYDAVVDYSGWREIEGVKFPFDITEDRTGKEPSQSFATYTEKIEVNVPIEDSLFAMPGPPGGPLGVP